MNAVSAHTEVSPAPRIAVSVEALAYALIAIIAVILRALRLSTPSLGEMEARQAFAALHLLYPDTAGAGIIISPTVFSGILGSFAVLGPSTAAARAFPMLASLGLVFAPLLFRARLGKLPALIAALLLALSPAGTAAARQVSGHSMAMMALIGVLAACAAYWQSGSLRPVLLAGGAAGLALLSDPAAPLGLLALGAGAAYTFLTDEEGTFTEGADRDRLRGWSWRYFTAGLAGALVVFGTLFFLIPDGLGAAGDLLAAFGRGLVTRQAGAPWTGLVIAIYEPATLLFGLIGIWLASQSAHSHERFLAAWGFAALVAVLIYPGALPEHTLWATIPLAGLAGKAIAALLSLGDSAPAWAARSHALGSVAFFGMILAGLAQHLRAPRMLTIPALTGSGSPSSGVPLDLVLVILWSLLVVVMWLTVASMWEPRTAWRGLGFAVLAITLIAAGGQSGALAFARSASPFEAFHTERVQIGMDMLADAAREVSKLTVGYPHDASLTVQTEPDGAVAWALRDFTHVSFVEQVNPTVDSVMAITPASGSDPALGSAYVGQDFVVIQDWSLAGMTIPQAAQWVIYRTAPTAPADQRMILWVRQDIYRLVSADRPQ